MTTPVLAEIERQKKISQAQTWDTNERALSEKLQAKLAARGKAPITQAELTLSDAEQELWQDFVAWAAVEGVRHLPARPSSVASFLLDRKLTHEQMLDAIAVITKKHDLHSLPNATATAAVRSVLELEIETAPPRTWKTEIKEIWARLPADIRYEIGRLERHRDVEFSRLWHKQKEFTKQLEKQIHAETKTETKSIERPVEQDRPASP
jgi:hypothetical protein